MASDFLIESGIPIPAGRIRASRASKWPFANMAVEDSVFVPEDMAKQARSASSAFAKAHGVKFTVRTVVERNQTTGQDNAGVRIWRMPDAINDDEPE